MKKVTKKSSQTRGFLPHGPLRCKTGKTEGPVLLPPVVAPGHRFRQNYQCPCRRTVQLVLPVFARSFSSDSLLPKSGFDLRARLFFVLSPTK
ncbi:hypothetical protein [Mucilaginibacter sp.]|uniref:hypothetical protein n=1 Tax=Mucilaginibacter sp. TaxID=1882438 RepID=UPI002606A251|nr:hypothetical protein [Mucilaginibacter sp.]